jgi:tol-pal system protein YbgF
MKPSLKYTVAGCLSAVLTLSAQAQVPVIEIQGNDAQNTSAASTGISSQSELILLVLQLQEDVRYLRGELETTQHKLQRLEADSSDRYRDMDRRLSVLMQAAMDSDALPPLSDPSDMPPAETPVAAETAADAEPGITAEPVSADDQQAYDEAFALVRAREFDQAISAFETFVQRYPEHTNTANGYYWLGELHLANESLEQASIAFETVLEQFPTHHKVPDALYKLGVTLSRMGEQERSRHMMQRVISEYPQSTAATLAQSFRPVESN